jgi:uncharacterized membrane protein YdjX (TVP38/TMEM64 family)
VHFRFRFLIFGLLAACAIAGIVWATQVKQATIDILQAVQSAGFWGPLCFIAIYVVACLLYLPGSLLTIGAGFIFGPVVGIPTVSVGSTLGAGAAFLLSRGLMRDWVSRAVAQRPEFRALEEAVAEEGFKVILLTRLSPILPFNLLNFALGLTTVSFRDYLLASWIGMLPGAVFYTYIGTMIKSIADLSLGQPAAKPGYTAILLVGLAATLLLVVLLARIARQACDGGRHQLICAKARGPNRANT